MHFRNSEIAHRNEEIAHRNEEIAHRNEEISHSSKLLDKNCAESPISENSEVNRAIVSQVHQALSEGEMR